MSLFPSLGPAASPAGEAALGPLGPLRPHRARVLRAGLRLLRLARASQAGAESVAFPEKLKFDHCSNVFQISRNAGFFR